ncbi:MAG: AAA family ATPase [Chloroflexi bacterium SZAS-1]|jgi:stage III sporulation protein SpoIIIAA|nr:AAA family ATPase [Chloroflexi bacterium SZAS-1]HNP88203.1 R3H domain-containing nucleic acid-binding protein [Kouleothrix sp.]
MTEPRSITSNIDLLLDTLPLHIRQSIEDGPDDKENLLEIVMDLGRLPEARYRGRERFLSDREVLQEDIDYVIQRIGAFGEDNRAGIPRTLHRISAIRNRSGKVIGLTCRVGRAVLGTIAIIRDLVESGRSLLLLGKPGVGKTTMLRETARVVAEDLRKRVVIVDTSNEIAGDGDIPHPGIGRARRMQVPRPAEQHGVMIEAVENHMPEVIVIDEIGTELEALAARTIAERGVQLIGTAHGNTLDNLMSNPTLSDLIGGIQAVTLGDDEARRRGTQKTVLERKAPPTFDVLVEIQSWDQVLVYTDVASAVDSILRGEEPQAELRSRDADGQVHIVPGSSAPSSYDGGDHNAFGGRRAERTERNGRARAERRIGPIASPAASQPQQRVYPFGVSRDRLERAIANLRVPAVIVRDMQEATMVMTLKNYYRQGSDRIRHAEDRGVPVYVLRNNTITQMERQLADVFHLQGGDDDEEALTIVPVMPAAARRSNGDTSKRLTDAMMEAEQAITKVMNGERSAVELTPRESYVRRLQHQLAERYNVNSESRGREPNRRVKIYRG